MKLGKNSIATILSTVVLAACVVVSLATSSDDESSTIIITPNETTSLTTSIEEDEIESTTSSTTTEKKTSLTTSKTSKVTTTTSSTTSTSTTQTTYNFPADINKASVEMLCAVNGIGEAMASRIITYRENIGGFTSMYDLLNIDGIGEKRLATLMNYFYVENDVGSTTSATTTTTTTAKKSTTASKTTKKSTAKTTTTTTKKERRKVNINTANAAELEDALLISEEMAEEIVEVRKQIGGEYVNIRELLMVTDFTPALLVEVQDYLEL